MRIRKNDLGNRIFFVGILLLWFHFFYWISFPQIVEFFLKIDNFMMIVSFLSILLVLAMVILRKRVLKKYRSVVVYICVLITTVFMLCVYTVLMYPQQRFFTTLKSGMSFLVIVFTIPIVVMLEKNKNTESLWKTVNLISLTWCVTIVIQSAIYSQRGEFVLDFVSFFRKYANQGDFGLRISMYAIGNFMILYNFIKMYYTSGKKRMWYILNLGIGIYVLIFIQQTRSLWFYICVCFLIMLIRNKKSNRALIAQISTVVIIAGIFLFTDIIPRFFASFSVYGQRAYSTSARLYAIEYYLECFKNSPIFGNGLADGYGDSAYFTVEHGALGMAYYSDVGFIGLLANTGLCALVIFIWPLLRMVKIYNDVKGELKGEERELLFIGIIYTFITSLTYLVTVSQNAILLPILMGYFEYIYANVHMEGEKSVKDQNNEARYESASTSMDVGRVR